jgi:FkbM family methyltransferase
MIHLFKVEKIKTLAVLLFEKRIFFNFELLGHNLKVTKDIKRKRIERDYPWLFHLAKHSEHFYDVGCNVGYISLIAAVLPNSKYIVALDPNPEAMSITAQNLIINGFGIKCKFITAFISDKSDQEVKFFTVGSGEAGSMFATHAVTAASLNSFYYVKTITIDEIMNLTKIIPDLIKIDVEGAENLALKGSVELAKKQITKIFVELHSVKERSMFETARFVINWCVDNDYVAYYLTDGKILQDPQKIAHRGKCHVLLLPKNIPYPEYLLNIQEGSELPRLID